MSSRHRVRELALQVLFLWDASGSCEPELASRLAAGVTEDTDALAEATRWATGAWENREAADALVQRLAPQWPPHRQPGVDRSLLRLAIWELGAVQTPPKVVIDEAIELAKAWSTEQSPAFVNGVLDAVLRERGRPDRDGVSDGSEGGPAGAPPDAPKS
jgi:N utilization substance protein B